jgi:hypothetical protein
LIGNLIAQGDIIVALVQPSPSCAFVFLPTSMGSADIPISDDLSAILSRLGREAEIAQLARGVFTGVSERDLPGLSRLTTRELEIVTGLLQGDLEHQAMSITTVSLPRPVG